VKLLRVTSPHLSGPARTSWVMQQVMLGCVPGVVALLGFFGWGVLINIALACAFAVGFEALMLWIRKRPISIQLKDCSALLTAVLLGIALPPLAPWWLILIGILFSIVVAKQLYGGLGNNPFNPAMVGYVVLLISFPVEMTRWAAPTELLGTTPALSFTDSLRIAFGFVDAARLDAVTMATPLDLMRQNTSLIVSELWNARPQFGNWGGIGWEWVNAGFLAGGLYLIWRGIFSWHAPGGMLLGLAIMATLFYDGGSSASSGSPLFHLFSGASMFGAFFIVTDPVTSATSQRGRLIFGLAVGVLVYVIRTWGNYPDAVAFAVLLMNFAAPFLDHYTQPRTYGHTGGGGQ